MSHAAVEAAAAAAGLIVMGGFHPQTGGTLILLGTGPAFWAAFRASAEATDGAPHPVDRWSKRVIGSIAAACAATCSFPSDGPPYAPFIAWAMATGRFAQSPVGMMVHDRVGMMISLRGALHFTQHLALPARARFDPCTGCPAPCASACPVGALSAAAPYDVPACHDFLDGDGAKSCMVGGCLARRACPLSRGAGRRSEQSALHMRSFHPS
ncbi:ferredoxin [Seohaeicola saemankumensis]|nr:ferredoxin [Seohaeicola saemankumensis]MCA0872946.1 ferredoxin [Seohaeicola saemankumensis]